MRPESPAAIAEVSTGFRNRPGCDAERLRFGRDVQYPDHLAILQTFICCRLADRHHKISPCLSSLWCRAFVVVMFHSGCGGGALTQSLLCKFGKLHG